MFNLWSIIGAILHLVFGLFSTSPQIDNAMLCVFAYQDLNRNGINDNEPPLPNVKLTLRDDKNTIVGQLLTAESPRCFENIPIGTYQLWAENGPYRVLSPLMQTLTIAEESQVIELAAIASNTPSANEICISVFEDLNQNGVQDATEGLVGNVDVWLLSDDVIIGTQLTQPDEPTCFVGLEEGAYQIKIPPTRRHQMTTRSDAAPTFVGVGNRFSISFGLVLLEAFHEDALLPDAKPNIGKLTLDTETRLLLAIMGSGVVILLMLGVGSIAFALWRRK